MTAMQHFLEKIKENNLSLEQVYNHCQNYQTFNFLPSSFNPTYSDYGDLDMVRHKFCYTKCWQAKSNYEHITFDEKGSLAYLLGMLGAPFKYRHSMCLELFQQKIEHGIKITKLIGI